MAETGGLSAKLAGTAALLSDNGQVMLVGPALDALVILLRDLAEAAEQHEEDEVVTDSPDTAVSDRYCNDELLAGSLADAILGSMT